MRSGLGVLVVLAGLVAGSVVLATGVAGQFEGSARCGECHRAALEAWQTSIHARAQQALPSEHAADPRCVQCHGSSETGRAGVQCESCHGAGKHYSARYVMKDSRLSRIVGLEDVGEKTCRRCHTGSSPSIQPFDYDAMWKLIEHGLAPDEDATAGSGPAGTGAGK